MAEDAVKRMRPAPRRRRAWLAHTILVIGLLSSALAAAFAYYATENAVQERFAHAVEETQRTIQARIDIYVALLRGTAGIFATTPEVTRRQLRAYVDRLDLQTNYPGIQGIGFARRTAAADIPALTERIRRQGLERFHLWNEPDPERRVEQPEDADAFPIVFLEPLDRRNLVAVGFDMFTEKVRHEAMDRAWKTGQPAASGRVTLVQEIDPHKQAGFLIYLPVFAGTDTPEQPTDRVRELRGFVYSPFRADDLFRGIFSERFAPSVGFSVYDGTTLTSETLMHRSVQPPRGGRSEEMLTSTRSLLVAGRPWTIRYEAPKGALLGTFNPAPAVLVAGAVISVLLFLFQRAQERQRRAAERHAEDLAEEQRATTQSELRKRAILETALDGIVSFDDRGVVVEINPAAERLFGWPAAEAIGRDYREVVALEGSAENPALDLARFSRDRLAVGSRVEAQARRRGGETFPAEVAVTRVALEEQPLFTAFVRDLSDRKRAEQGLAQANQFRDKVMESAVIGLMALDREGRFTLANEHLARLTGRSRDELVGQSYTCVLSSADAARLGPHFGRVIEHHESLLNEEVDLRRPDGSVVSVVFSWAALSLEGRVTGVVGTATDISAQKRARAEITRLNEELEQRVLARTAQLDATNRELEAFSYSVSHDLRAPLRHIDGFVELLRGSLKGRLVEDEQRFFDIISSSAQRMGTLIDNLLAFSRAGRTELRAGRVDMSGLVEEVRRELELEIGDRVVEWEVGSLPGAMGDRGLLRQVWMNLLSNAVKYTRRRPRARIEIGASQDRDELVYFVRDNGAGFDMQYAHKLFGVFQRLHFAEEFEGTGIGLANVRRIVARHGGRTWAEGKLDAGATFFFSLPGTKQ